MLNSVTMIGRTTKDVELKVLPNGTNVATLNIAVDRSYKDKEGNKITDFFMCDCFGKTAEFASNYISKGRLVAITGEVHNNTYEKDGQKRTITKINISTIKALDFKKDNENNNATGLTPEGFQAIDSDDLIPF
ncbi:MAG: single-stranded DNA-binding protein [Peptostreptococcaceae bacterium]